MVSLQKEWPRVRRIYMGFEALPISTLDGPGCNMCSWASTEMHQRHSITSKLRFVWRGLASYSKSAVACTTGQTGSRIPDAIRSDDVMTSASSPQSGPSLNHDRGAKRKPINTHASSQPLLKDKLSCGVNIRDLIPSGSK